MANVILKSVVKIYDKNVIAVNDINIEIEDKEFVVLVGPSGCGKSTILRMIAGLEEISEGEIYIGDRLVNEVPPKGRDIAMVFQNYALYPHMTVFQNMSFGLRLHKYPKHEIIQRVNDAVNILGIKDLLDRKPKALSGGQRQRVAVGRAIVRNPKVFLFDEPLSNLDAKLRVQMRTEISKLHQKLNTTIIYVTHDQVEAMTMGDRIVVLKDGRIQQIDNPLNLYNLPKNKFVAGFLGSPPMNFIKGKIIRDDHIWFDEGGFKWKLDSTYSKPLEKHINTEVIIGIRPEDIYESRYASDIKEKSEVTVTVEVIEPMGNEIYLYATAGSHPIVARLSNQFNDKINQKIKLIFNMAKIHFFDMKTEESIVSGSNFIK